MILSNVTKPHRIWGWLAIQILPVSKAKYDLIALLHHDDILMNNLFEKWIDGYF